MPSSGTGTGTPLLPGTPGASLNPVEALPYTLLSLPRYARIMGINPVHFAGAFGNTIWPLENNRCSNIWSRYSWQQSDIVSHQDLAQVILEAEDELANHLGYWPAPRWIPNEMHQYPGFYRPELTTVEGRKYPDGLRATVNAKWGKVVTTGPRAVALVGTATATGGTLVYQDLDADGFFETARVDMTTTLTDIRELKVYFVDQNGDQRWEIRPVRSKALSGGVATFLFDSWLFIDPGLLGAYTTDAGFAAIEVSDTSNYVSSVDVYREYADPTAAASQFFWEPTDCNVCSACAVSLETGGSILLETAGTTSTCTVCGLTYQDGCLMVRDVENGILIPAPAAYDSDVGDHVLTTYGVARDPDIVKLWYYAGDVDEYYLRGTGTEPLSDFWAQTIVALATARLHRPFCSCSNVTSLAERWREDIAFSGGDSSYIVNFDSLDNPFGTRRGELFAWKRVASFGKKQVKAYAI